MTRLLTMTLVAALALAPTLARADAPAVVTTARGAVKLLAGAETQDLPAPPFLLEDSHQLELAEGAMVVAAAKAGLDKINPSSVILSGAMLLEYIGWDPAADMVRQALSATVGAGEVTYDLARQIEGAEELSCSAFGRAIVERM